MPTPMKVLVQWVRTSAPAWEEHDAAGFAALPTKADVTPSSDDGSDLDDVAGWVNELNIQGMSFKGDHVAVEDLGDGSVRVTQWNDDERFWVDGEGNPQRMAKVFTIKPLEADASMGGAINTSMTCKLYTDPGMVPASGYGSSGTWSDGTVLGTFADFLANVLPSIPTASIRHGKMMPDSLLAEHKAARMLCGWRDSQWTGHLDASETDQNGRLLSQRDQGRYAIPSNTRTYFQANEAGDDMGISATQLPNTIDVTVDRGGTSTETATSVDGARIDALSGITDVGFQDEPDSAAWPAGVAIGDYKVQVDITAVAANFSTIGVGGVPATNGGFKRAAADGNSVLETEDDTGTQTPTTGLMVFESPASIAWSAGAVADRFGFVISLNNTGMMGDSDDITFEFGDADAFAEGPWAPSLTLHIPEGSPGADDIAVADAIEVELFRVIEVELADAISVADVIVAEITGGQEFTRNPMDSIAVADEIETAVEYARDLADAIAVADAIEVGFEFAVAIADSVSAADAMATELEFARNLADAVNVADAIEAATEYARQLADTISVADAIAAGLEFAVELADVISVADAITAEIVIGVSLSDVVAVVDEIKTEVSYARELADAISVADAIETTTEYARDLADTLSVADEISTDLILGVSASDTITVTDAMTVEVFYSRELDDAVLVTDSIEALKEVGVDISDSISVVDSLQVELEFLRTAADAISVTDSVTAGLVFGVQLADAIAVTDDLQREHDVSRLLSDTIAVTDALGFRLNPEQPSPLVLDVDDIESVLSVDDTSNTLST